MKHPIISDLSDVLTVFIIITLLYLVLIGSLIIGFDKVETFYVPETVSRTKFSLLIPFRNEADNLPILLASILKLDYPKNLVELIFIDDASVDNSRELIGNFLEKSELIYRVIQNEGHGKSPKKDAISLGVKNAKNDWVITTDADCRVPKYWLDAFNGMINQQNPDMVVAPVVYYSSSTFLDRFQSMDNLSLQAVTIGAFGLKKAFLCNGANLAYKKTGFLELNGFSGNEHIASGDDLFLMEKFTVSDKKVIYLKSDLAIVETIAQPNIGELISQRIRWAAKTKKYNSLFAKVVATSVFLMNAVLIVGLIFSILGEMHLKSFLSIFVIKISIDFLLLFKSARFLNKETVLLSYFLAAFFYPFFTVFIGIRAALGGFIWKDRTYNR